MPEEPEPRRGELREDPLLHDVDPATITDAQALHGFLGRSTEDGFWRLYLSSSLDAYLEIRDQDIVASRALGERSPTAGTIVWVRREAKVRRVTVGPLQAHADFLRGEIARSVAVGQRFPVGESTEAYTWPTINLSCWTLCPECWPVEAQARRPGR
jgi:hypothetical protein